MASTSSLVIASFVPLPSSSSSFLSTRSASLWRMPSACLRASDASSLKISSESLRTCRNCKKQFRPSENHSRACFYHTAHFGGETKRKFESVHTGGTMDTPGGGEISSYWHCCGSEDPFDLGCVAAPHAAYDD